MHTGLLECSVARIRAAWSCWSERVEITDARSTKDVRSIKGGPTVEAAKVAAKHHVPLPNQFAGGILRQAIEEIISSILRPNAYEAALPQIDDIGGSTEINVTESQLVPM